MKAKRHYEEWDLNECLFFINTYLDHYKNREQSILIEQIASELERTFAAIKLRIKEVVGILTDKQRGIYNITPNMVKAIDIVIKERQISKTKLLVAFDD